MKKILYLFLLFQISINFKCFSEIKEGCSDGNRVYPNFSGNYHYNCPPQYCPIGVPIYNSNNDIWIQTYDKDPQCGIKFGTHNATTHGGGCKIYIDMSQTSYKDGSGLVYYDTNNITCNLPLDDYIPFIVLISAGFGFIFLRSSKFNLMGSH